MRHPARRSSGKRHITLHISSVDGYSKKASFTTLAGAQKAAQKAIGKHPETGGSYAVDPNFGSTKVMVSGATLQEIFPEDPVCTCPRDCFEWESEEGHLYCIGRAEGCARGCTCTFEDHGADKARWAAHDVKVKAREEKEKREQLERASRDPIPF